MLAPTLYTNIKRILFLFISLKLAIWLWISKSKSAYIFSSCRVLTAICRSVGLSFDIGCSVKGATCKNDWSVNSVCANYPRCPLPCQYSAADARLLIFTPFYRFIDTPSHSQLLDSYHLSQFANVWFVAFYSIQASLTTTQTLTINVLDEQDTAPYFDGEPYQARTEENRPAGSLVIQVNARDGDTSRPRDVEYYFINAGQ